MPIRRKARISALVLLGMSMLMAGCGLSAQDKEAKAEKEFLGQSGRIHDQEQARSKAALTLDKTYLQAANAFGLSLFRELAKEDKDKNIVLSPYSVSEALGMAWNGSGGKTMEEMAQAVGWSGSQPEEIAANSRELRSYLRLPAEGVKLKASNSFWYQKGLHLLEPYEATLKNSYEASLQAVDLPSPKTVEAMNEWTSKHTEGMIESVFDPSQTLDPDNRAIMMNAVYFKGAWKDEFDPARTKPEPFRTLDGAAQKVPMMQRSGSYAHVKTERLEAVRIPYLQDKLDLLVVVPQAGLGVPDIVGDLERYGNWKDQLAASLGSVALPRFKVSCEADLIPALQHFGMQNAFVSGTADFTGMFEPSAPSSGLFINLIKHQAVLEVNERGTEAAAVTALGMAGTSAPSDPFSFRADRPFFYAIEDTTTGLWLFLGAINDPLAA
ncbi:MULTISPECIES: serpin family protein [unclassified Paenibacillus]|uniref:serpin family protein n=1 Tax=unclassified Paenibacillus TaxID=185978 RepID=UPI000957026E|nr:MULTISPECIES: serpin family protein [unclassified Paenibacillus]ASS64899.1 serpin family protein [Paenibacillus sp. RUD330]SIR02171.1 serpin B [Paenibacillus sp. RU4X]SIR32990.1 serpin B [Paenibacillus sp. RU4T]